MTTEHFPDEPRADEQLMGAVTALGDALRELVETSVRTTVGSAELAAVAGQARELAARLAVAQRPVHQLPALDDPITFRRVYSPVTGVGSALAPPLEIRQDGAGVVAETSLGQAYEGPPGYLHGGMSSLFMDQLLGAAAIAAGLWGMTVRLELDYRRPVPLRTPLVFRAHVTEPARSRRDTAPSGTRPTSASEEGRVTEDAGRRSVVAGTIATADAPERTLVEARGVFVAPRPEQQAAYFGAITDAQGRHAPPRRPTDATELRPRFPR